MFDLSPEDITDGPLLRALLVLAGPLLVQNLVQIVQQIVDLFWVGRLSGEAVAAIGLVFPLQGLAFAATVATFVGTQILVSQRIGGEDRRGAQRALFTGMSAAVGLGAGVAVLGLVVAGPLVGVIESVQPGTVADGVGDLALEYFTVILLGLPLMAITDATESGFIGWGDSRTALYLNLTAIVINLALDPILIFGFQANPLFGMVGAGGLEASLFAATGFTGIGIAGAALATVVGYGVGLLLALGLIRAGRNGGMLSRAAATLRRDELYELLDVGVPSAGQLGAKQAVEFVLVVVTFAAGGAAGLSAYIVGVRVASVAVIPAIGLQQAAQSVVGQNLGANNPDRARRTTWLGVAVAGGALVVIGAIQWLIPGTLTTAFVPELSADAARLSREYLRILAYGYPAIGAAYLLQAGFNGARRTRTSFVASLIQYWGVRLPIAVVGGIVLLYGVHAVFWSVTLSNIAAAIGLAIYYRRETANGMLSRAADVATAD